MRVVYNKRTATGACLTRATRPRHSTYTERPASTDQAAGPRAASDNMLR